MERPLALKIWFPITISTFLYYMVFEVLPKIAQPPTGIPPELAPTLVAARLVSYFIIEVATVMAMYGAWIGNKIAYVACWIALIGQIYFAAIGQIALIWIPEALIQMLLLALSWRYFFG